MPEEIASKVTLSKKDLFWDSDAFTRPIYNVHDLVDGYIDTPIARAGVDLNRDESDLPPENPDGVVKQKTCLGVDLYPEGRLPARKDVDTLIRRYYRPYHGELRKLTRRSSIRLALDCHSMLPEGPVISPDRGEQRPLFCLSNQNGQTCPVGLLESVRTTFAQAFEVDERNIRLNEPFKGGYITRTYGNKSLPWIQVEMNRSLYLSPEWFNHESLEIDRARLSQLNEMFRRALIKISDFTPQT